MPTIICYLQRAIVLIWTDKATDENLTSENWEFILNVCDKVNESPDNGYVLTQFRGTE